MGYVDHILQPGETVIHRAKLHWLIYSKAIALLVVAAALAVLGQQRSDELGQGLLYGALAVLALAILAALAAAIRRATTELAVTDHRVIFKRGLLSRHTIEMNRSKVESVDVDQTLMGRIFGYGTILVRGTGGSLEPLRNIENPLALRSHITVG